MSIDEVFKLRAVKRYLMRLDKEEVIYVKGLLRLTYSAGRTDGMQTIEYDLEQIMDARS